ncbi:hypothetical protein V1638_00100 [Pseudarthrobacter sp. J64]|uniref:hypothetical protein n=1 Tax=Pseudarthrobacter sp. J64 TaxID=3116485 RepID=UPI002E80A421|nr:hypothetical protein [Pseudarthrobacter sp. J64]MEE2567801.1 hypothetical protein [Pseudarthrobacter sp. J64]
MTLPRPAHRRALALAAGAAVVLSATACAPRMSVEDADIPAWQATALPAPSAGPGAALELSGRLMDAEPSAQTETVAAGSYSLTLVCEGGGKAFLAVTAGGEELVDLGAACHGSRETAKLEFPGGPVEFSISSVDAPVLYAYGLVPAG